MTDAINFVFCALGGEICSTEGWRHPHFVGSGATAALFFMLM